MKVLLTIFVFCLALHGAILGQSTTNAPPSPNATSLNEGPLLLDACLRSDIKQAADLLMRGAPVNVRGKGGVTPLILAANTASSWVSVQAPISSLTLPRLPIR